MNEAKEVIECPGEACVFEDCQSIVRQRSSLDEPAGMLKLHRTKEGAPG